MNQSQRKYLVERITEVANKKCQDIKNKYIDYSNGYQTSINGAPCDLFDMINEIRSGNVKLKSEKELACCKNRFDLETFFFIFDFSEYAASMKVPIDERDEKIKKIKKILEDTKDEIMFVDSKESIDFIKSFRKTLSKL